MVKKVLISTYYKNDDLNILDLVVVVKINLQIGQLYFFQNIQCFRISQIKSQISRAIKYIIYTMMGKKQQTIFTGFT